MAYRHRRKQLRGMDIDMNCEFCREAVARIERDEVGPLEIIVIKPDINSAGIETNRHVEIFKVNHEGRMLDAEGAGLFDGEFLHPDSVSRASERYGKNAYGWKNPKATPVPRAKRATSPPAQANPPAPPVEAKKVRIAIEDGEQQ